MIAGALFAIALLLASIVRPAPSDDLNMVALICSVMSAVLACVLFGLCMKQLVFVYKKWKAQESEAEENELDAMDAECDTDTQGEDITVSIDDTSTR